MGKYSKLSFDNIENIRYKFLLQIMKTMLKKIIPKTQELPIERRLAVKYLRESGMSFRKIVGQLNFHLFYAL